MMIRPGCFNKPLASIFTIQLIVCLVLTGCWGFLHDSRSDRTIIYNNTPFPIIMKDNTASVEIESRSYKSFPVREINDGFSILSNAVKYSYDGIPRPSSLHVMRNFMIQFESNGELYWNDSANDFPIDTQELEPIGHPQ
jgi:hypothetical protein